MEKVVSALEWRELTGVQETQISPEDKKAIKAQLVPVMIALGTPSTARLQSQIGEALSMIAAQDFPENWEGLCDVSKQV